MAGAAKLRQSRPEEIEKPQRILRIILPIPTTTSSPLTTF